MTVNKVLISTDFSKASDLLLNCIPELKALDAKEIILAHVVDVSSAGGSASLFIESNKDKLEKIKKSFTEDGINMAIDVRVGFPALEILNIAREHKVSLILIGSQGASVVKRLFLGSTALDLVRISDVPVLVEKYIKDKDRIINACINKFSKVLIACDFSICSSNAIDFISSLKGSIDEVILAAVIERASDAKDSEETLRKIQKELDILSGRFKGIKVSTSIKYGDASNNIVKLAEDEGATLIAFGKKGQGRIKEILLGSTAQDIVRNTKIATLVIPC